MPMLLFGTEALRQVHICRSLRDFFGLLDIDTANRFQVNVLLDLLDHRLGHLLLSLRVQGLLSYFSASGTGHWAQ